MTSHILSNLLKGLAILVIGDNETIQVARAQGQFGNGGELFLARGNLEVGSNGTQDWSSEFAFTGEAIDLKYSS
jgi:hypothetical protein